MAPRGNGVRVAVKCDRAEASFGFLMAFYRHSNRCCRGATENFTFGMTQPHEI